MILKIFLETITVAPTTLSQTITQTRTTTITKTVAELKESQKLLIHPVRHVVRQTPQRNATMGTNAVNRPPPRLRRPERQNQVQEKANQNDSNETIQAATRSLN